MPPDYTKSVRFKKCPISLIDNIGNRVYNDTAYYFIMLNGY